MSGADVEAVCREAAMLALREKMEVAAGTSQHAQSGSRDGVAKQRVSLAHFERAARAVRPSISAATSRFYLGLQQQLEP